MQHRHSVRRLHRRAAVRSRSSSHAGHGRSNQQQDLIPGQGSESGGSPSPTQGGCFLATIAS